MHNLSSRLALVAVLGAITAISPALAAPANGPHHPSVDGSIAPTDSSCPRQPGDRGKGRHSNANSNDNGGGGNGDNFNGGAPMDNAQQDDGQQNLADHQHRGGTDNGRNGNWQNDNGPPQQGNNGQGMGNWSHRDRDQFHQRFGNFNFGFFAAPTFSIQLGVRIPHSYDLRPVPRSIYRSYPEFRGYLFFETRRGDFVIVSPRTYRVVAII